MHRIDTATNCHESGIVGETTVIAELANAVFGECDSVMHEFEFAIGADVKPARTSVPQHKVLGG